MCMFQYNLGTNTKKWVTSKQYNDGKWHKVTATRDGAKGKFEVDGEDVIDRTNQISGTSLELIETISFGGYPHRHNYPDVTQDKFDGCINNVTIMADPIDLHANIKEYDVTPGCPAKFASMVSFAKNSQGYVGWDRLSINNDFTLSLKFKTKEKDGLIFYVTDAEQDNGVSLALRNGQLIVISQGIELVSKDTFNDGAWHVVSVMHNDRVLRMDLDDYSFKETDISASPLYVYYANIYIGGLPKRIHPKKGAVGSQQTLHGCIVDLTVNGNVKNFADTTDKSSEILDKCILDSSTIDLLHPGPELPPNVPIPSYTTVSPEDITENPNPYVQSGRGDGGMDFPNTVAPITQQPEEVPATVLPVTTTTLASSGARNNVLPALLPPIDGCALPLNPVQESEAIVGYRFGTQKSSRLEYNSPRGKYKKNFDFRFEFKTKERGGILYYVSDQGHKQYAAVYLTDGYVVFKFQGNNTSLTIRSKSAYDDGNWHLVEFSREGSFGKLVVDGTDINDGNTPQKNVALDIKVPFFIGGLRPDSYNDVQLNLNTTESFNGCIRNFAMNNKPMETDVSHGVIPCSDHVELGTYFGGGINTFIKLREKFHVGTVFSIKMDIKPRTDSGVLITAHGKRDYYVLELHNGQLKLTVDNGRGPVTAVFHSSNNPYHLCDGQWHNIQAVKSKNVVTLSVDNLFTEPQVGPSFFISTDTGSTLFLGGHRFLKRVRGITARTPFIGCIKNVEINNTLVPLVTGMAEGNITIGSCPTN